MELLTDDFGLRRKEELLLIDVLIEKSCYTAID